MAPSQCFSGSASATVYNGDGGHHKLQVFSIALGRATQEIARGLFAGLRELDLLGVERIYVEGISERGEQGSDDDDNDDGAAAAAVMNRLRKAASEVV